MRCLNIFNGRALRPGRRTHLTRQILIVEQKEGQRWR
ncbi:hypothetical protein [Actinoplanes sp. CA-252034]